MALLSEFANPVTTAWRPWANACSACTNKLATAKIGHDKTALQREIEATDKQIDQLVYELYGLSEEEIKIIEESK